MDRARKIRNEIAKRIWANGGHQVELKMKRNGVATNETITVIRKGRTSFERLEADDFDVLLNGRQKLMKNAELMSVANYIAETWR